MGAQGEALEPASHPIAACRSAPSPAASSALPVAPGRPPGLWLSPLGAPYCSWEISRSQQGPLHPPALRHTLTPGLSHQAQWSKGHSRLWPAHGLLTPLPETPLLPSLSIQSSLVLENFAIRWPLSGSLPCVWLELPVCSPTLVSVFKTPQQACQTPVGSCRPLRLTGAAAFPPSGPDA